MTHGIRERTRRTQYLHIPPTRTRCLDKIEKDPLTSANFAVLIEEEKGGCSFRHECHRTRQEEDEERKEYNEDKDSKDSLFSLYSLYSLYS